MNNFHFKPFRETFNLPHKLCGKLLQCNFDSLTQYHSDFKSHLKNFHAVKHFAAYSRC